MTNLIKNFAKSESGAVTVDLVVLTAALVGLGLAVMAVVSGGVNDLSGEIQNALVAADPGTTTFSQTALEGDAIAADGGVITD
jgi:Flp pilus assembly pilin Flp